MKTKKLLSIACAVAMLASTFVATTASASLGGKPTATATFKGYEVLEEDGVSYYIATVDVEMDVTAAETLAEYKKSGSAIKGYTVEGNGVKGLGASWTIPNGFEFFGPLDSGVFTVGDTGDVASYFNTGAVNTYLTAYKYNFSVQYYTDNADLASEFKFTTDGTSITGTDSTVTVATKNPTSTPWAYDYAAGTLAVTDCTIPSYNEWSAPDEPTLETVAATPFTYDEEAELEGEEFVKDDSEDVDVYYAEYEFKTGQTKFFWSATIDSKTKKTADKAIPNVEGQAKLGIIIPASVGATAVALNVQ